MSTADLQQRLASLSPEQRALLEQKLRLKRTAVESNVSAEPTVSCSQESLWFIDQLQPGSPLYNIPQALRLRGPLVRPALIKALNIVVQRHEQLRTRFVKKDGKVAAEVSPASDPAIREIDLSPLVNGERDTDLAELLRVEAGKPFQLSSDPLIRLTLVRLNAEEHVLLTTMHHIVSDHWSFGIFYREVAAVYDAEVRGVTPQLKPLTSSYFNFAEEQRRFLNSAAGIEQLEFWRKELGNEPPVLELPTDKLRPAVQSFKGAIETIRFKPEVNEALSRFCRETQATPFLVMVAVFQTLLFRYTQQQEIVIGAPAAGRTRTADEDLVGFFVNTVVLKGTLTSEMTFRELLDQMRSRTMSALANQRVPFERLVEELRVRRDASRNPIFQTVFQYLGDDSSPEFTGLEVSLLPIENGTAKFDLNLAVVAAGDALTAYLEYATDLYHPETARRILQHLEMLLAAVLRDPGQKIGWLPLLGEDEQRLLIETWNETTTAFPSDKTVAQLFDEQAGRTPAAIAVQYGDKAITYAELRDQANRLAHYLKSCAVGADVLVGVSMERSPEMIVAWLAILKAGGAYVPLDPDYPKERLQFMVEDTRMPVILTQQKLKAGMPVKSAKIFCVDSDWPTLAKNSTSSPESNATPESLAYVIYTSGSTGIPKGVAVPNRAINRLVFNTNWMEFGPADRIAQISNSSFDAATFEVWGALLHGGRLIGLSREQILSPREFAAAIRKNELSAMFLTVALFNQMAAEAPDAFKGVKYVLFGGDAADPKWVREVLQKSAPEYLQNGYGPTECTTFAAWYRVTDVPTGATNIPIGRPIANTTFYVLDRNLQPVPTGISGELYLGGPGLARSYWNRPELTASRFVPNPFNASDRLYRTGDLVRYLPDGDVEFLGRIDQQVKIRGYRIELEEIEAVLEEHAGVRDSIVLARQDSEDKRLVAYVILKERVTASIDDLRTYLRQKLPDYMVPNAFVLLETFPLTPNGKVDRKALPAPEMVEQDAGEYCAPRTPLEAELARIWCQALGVPRVGIRDNFFDLGGHSLLAVRLFSEVERSLQKKIPLPTLFQAPTIEQLAQIIRDEGWVAPGSSMVEIQPTGSKPPIFWLHTLGGGGGGGLFTYRKLATLLGPDQPSYGFVAPPEPFERMEDMAANYIEQLRAIQPVGPYYLGGYCFGGVVAFEMARQLEASGNRVAFLGLIESSPPNLSGDARFTPEYLAHVVSYIPFFVQEAVSNPQLMASRLHRKADQLLGRVRKRLGRRSSQPAPSNGNGGDLETLAKVIDMSQYPKDFRRFAEIHWKALCSYRPQILDGRLTLFRTRARHLLNVDAEVSWRKLARGVDVRLVGGSHESILHDPHVHDLAVAVRSALAAAEQATVSDLAETV